MVRLGTGLVVLFVLLPLCMGWWTVEEDRKKETHSETSSSENTNKMVPFEVMTAEQKFLQEANHLLNLSPLDSCQHKVVDSLRQSCQKVSEEDIAKLSVQLLNCQSKAEGREIFTCTKDMSIAECTSPMDPHTWNAYHIISNRARSVCYSIRQSQFRAQTELAVNRLSQSTLQQLRAMEELSVSQDEIRQLAHESVVSLRNEQKELLKRQSEFSDYQSSIESSMRENVKNLAEERDLINSGQSLIHNLTKSIKDQLSSAQETLKQHETDRIEYQERMTTELNNLKQNVREVWSNIGNSTRELLILIKQMDEQYRHTQENLNTINLTISNVLKLLDSMNGAITVQLGWLRETMGGAQDGLHVLISIASHGVFLLIACLVLLFLKAPWFSRFMLLVLVVSNLILDISTGNGLSILQLVVLMGTILISNWGLLWYQYHHSHSKEHTPSLAPPISHTATPSSISDSRHSVDISDDEIEDLIKDINQNEGYLPLIGTTPQKTFSTVSNLTPDITNHSHNFRCVGVTRTGLPCRLYATPGSQHCFRHRQQEKCA